jgi:hypothetical protein
MKSNKLYQQANETLFSLREQIREGKSQKDLTKVFKKYTKEYLNAYNEAKKNGYSRKKKVA